MNRAEAAKARRDTRTWVVTRRARTRQLIELGGLVRNSGLAAIAGDDRALLFGALLDVAQRLGGPDGPQLAARLRRLGARAFADVAAAAVAAQDEAAEAARTTSSLWTHKEEKGGTDDG